jgi:hypothetical protein
MDGNEQPNNDLGNASDFIKSVQSPVETTDTTPQIPEQIGEIPSDQFFSGMNSLTEGQVKDYQGFQELLGLRDKYSDLEKKNREYEAQSKINPFASDLSKEINDMLGRGADQKELVHFLKLQSMDIDSMSDRDAILAVQRMELKGKLNDKDLEDWYDKTYGSPDEDEELTGAQKYQIVMAAQEAKQKLQGFKKDSGEPEAVRQSREREATFKSNYGFWHEVIEGTIAAKENLSLSVGIGKDKEGKDIMLDYDFPIPAEAKQVILQESAKYAASNGLGRNKESFEQIQQFADRMLWAQYGKQIAENAVRNAKSLTTEEVLKQQHNVRTLNQGGDNRKPKVDVGNNKDAAAALRALARRESKRKGPVR